MSLFVAPTGIIDKLEKLRRNFLWGGSEGNSKIHWVSWNKIIANKSDGGLGVGSIKAFNTALIVKWWWRFRSEPESIWAKAISSIHNLQGKPDHILSLKTLPRVWNNIACSKKDLDKCGITINMVMEKQSTNEGDDLKWTCPLSSNGNYQVNTLRRKLDGCSSVDIGRFEWVKEIPIKVSTFIWRAKQERIPTSVALSKRGVNVTSTM